MCLAESLFCSNNILNTAFFFLTTFFLKKKKPKHKIFEKKPKAQLAQTPSSKIETNRKTYQNQNQPKSTVFQLF